LILVEGLTLILNGQPILKRVGLEAHPGEITALLGPNGSGKTTLFFCLSSHLRPQAGSISLGGRALGELSRRDLARLLATVPQEHHPVFPYSLRDLILLGRFPRVGFFGGPGPQDHDKMGEIMDLLGLTYLAEQPYTWVSGEERQLVLIGRCLAQEPRMLLLDEPTSHLDLRNQALVWGLVRRLAEEHGLTVLLTRHDANLAFHNAHRVILLHEGEVVAQRPTTEVITPEVVSRLSGLEAGMLSDGQRRLLYPLS
jgi:iron complex transport system ATP-binding protein